jgi:hypothetical protein
MAERGSRLPQPHLLLSPFNVFNHLGNLLFAQS